MKKLIVALCATAFALGVQAASVDWHFVMPAMDANFEEMAGSVTLYFNDVLIGTAQMENGEAKGDFVIDDGGGTVRAVAEITNFADGAGTLEYVTVIQSLPVQGYPDNDTYLGEVSDIIMNGVTNDGTIDISLTIADNGYSPAAPDIPEPTTGLLVLLGIAGLALKRKQA